MVKKKIYPDSIPEKILNRNYLDDIILYALGMYGPLEKSEFSKINKTTFYNNFNKLKDKGFVDSKRKGKFVEYFIKPTGEVELLKRLDEYKLDLKHTIQIEQKRISNQIEIFNIFFEKNGITDDFVKIEFLQIFKEIPYDDSLSVFSEDKFYSLLLFIVLNNPRFYQESKRLYSIDQFIEEFNTLDEDYLSDIDVKMFIQEIVLKQKKGSRIFCLDLGEDKFLFFKANSQCGQIFEDTINNQLKDLYYLKNLKNSKIFSDDVEEIIDLISYQLIEKYQLFNNDMDYELKKLISTYISDMHLEIIEKPIIPSKLSHDIIPVYYNIPMDYGIRISDNELDESPRTMRLTFKRIREKDIENKYYETALDFYNNKNYEDALIQIEKALEKNPNQYDFLELKSYILEEIQDYKNALEIFLKIYNERKGNEKGFDQFEELQNVVYLANLYYKLKDYSKSYYYLDLIPKILSEGTEFSLEEHYLAFEFYKLEALVLYEIYQLNKAIKSIEKDLELIKLKEGWLYFNQSHIEAYSIKTKILMRLNRFKEALDFIDKAIELDNKNTTLIYLKARIFFNMGELENALNLIEELLKKEPKTTNFIVLKIKILIESNLFDKGLEVVNSNIEDNSNNVDFYILKADILHKMKKYKDLNNLLEENIKKFDENVDMAKIKVETLIHKKKYGEALNIIEDLIKKYPLRLDLTIIQCLIYYYLGNYNAAYYEINRAIKSYPEYPNFYHTKALISLYKKDYLQVLETIEEGLLINPNFYPFYTLKAEIFRRRYKFDSAIEFNKKALELSPSDKETYLNIANSLRDSNKIANAIEVIDKALVKFPYFDKLYTLKASILRNINDFENALKTIETAIKLNPYFIQYYTSKASILRQLNRNEDALKVIDNAIQLDPYDHQLYSSKAGILGKLKDFNRALLMIEKALELNPNSRQYLKVKEKLIKELRIEGYVI